MDLTKIIHNNGKNLQKDELPAFYVVGLQEMVDLEMIGSVLCSKDVERM